MTETGLHFIYTLPVTRLMIFNSQVSNHHEKWLLVQMKLFQLQFIFRTISKITYIVISLQFYLLNFMLFLKIIFYFSMQLLDGIFTYF